MNPENPNFDPKNPETGGIHSQTTVANGKPIENKGEQLEQAQSNRHRTGIEQAHRSNRLSNRVKVSPKLKDIKPKKRGRPSVKSVAEIYLNDGEEFAKAPASAVYLTKNEIDDFWRLDTRQLTKYASKLKGLAKTPTGESVVRLDVLIKFVSIITKK